MVEYHSLAAVMHSLQLKYNLAHVGESGGSQKQWLIKSAVVTAIFVTYTHLMYTSLA